MIERGYEEAVRLYRERGLRPGEAANRDQLFRLVRTPQSYPEKTSPYFHYLLENQIKKKTPQPVRRPNFLRQLRTMARRRALG